MTQRNRMRIAFQRSGAHHQRAIEDYASAEKAGEVQRRRNCRGLSAEDYAARLLQDGLKKRWIYET